MNLKDALKQGDPAAGDPGLSPEEIHAMRRTVLSAAPEPRRRGWLVPVVGTAAVLILAALIGLSLWRQQPAPAHPTKLASEGRAVAPSPAQRGRVGEGASPPAPKDPLPFPPPRQGAGEGASRPARDVKVARVRPRPVATPKPEPTVEVAETHQIQFSTPGGTRIIWVLNPAAE
jgi:hypothetical protein